MREIRGHHLFCMALFTGHGYSEAFAENMAAVLESLRAGEAFRLTCGRDDVCTACPNLLPEGGCALGTEDVSRRDQAAFDVLGVSPGQVMGWQAMGESLKKVDELAFGSVCGRCRWAKEGLCSWAVLQRQIAGYW